MSQHTISLKLNGMHCPSCAVDIDLSLEDLPGIKTAATSYPKSSITITYDSSTIQPEIIKQEIKKLGYEIND